MLRIFKKCEKSVNNPYGSKEIKNLDTYDQPFLLCISAQDKNDKSVFGIIKEGARAARVRTSDELAGGFKIDEMGLDFLGLKYDYSNIKDKKSNSLVDDFLYPFLKRGKDIRKQARKINILTYCNATNVYIQAEKRLRELLEKTGKVLVVEHNHGQYLHEVERVAKDNTKVEFLGRISGGFILPEEVVKKAEAM